MTDVRECTVADLHAAWQRKDLIVDVREPDEFAEGHVPSAVSIPLSQLATRLGEIHTDGPVYVVCRSGRRSIDAARTLSEAGFQALSVSGGTLEWVSVGHHLSAPHQPGVAL